MHRNDLFGRVMGMAIFIAGVGILVFVFVMSYLYFTSNPVGVPASAKPGVGPSAAGQLGASAVAMFGRIALLIVMAITGSIIAARGIQLYFAASDIRRGSLSRNDD
ncbi:MAG: hypothetical protein ABFD54_14000 [Armatimonadota bacterium]|nr:hypothetical protein [bacterium]